MEKFREELQFFCVFLKKMYFLTLESVLSCFLAQFALSVQEKKRIKYTIFAKKSLTNRAGIGTV